MKHFLAFAAIVLASAVHADFVYNNFTAPTDLQLNGSATLSGPVLRLTVADVSGQAGTAWHTNAQDLSNGFAVAAVFNGNGTSDLGQWGPNNGADGVAFAFQGDGVNALGDGGGDNGIGGVPNMVALSFRTFWDDIHLITTDSNGMIVDDMSVGFAFNDNTDYALSATYNAATFDWNVFVDNNFVANFNLNASGILNAPVYAGLASGTGGADNNNDIKAWAVFAEPVPEPGSIAAVAAFALAAFKRKKQ
ncbi:MAG: hypothetical protein JSS71_12650 [Armatimonadetes bacterium]|nr:hypothetical protein [Armatimonadota bacterium]MBX3109126.1 hypothetical protein [Fimbriimonadaceae bacterium]